MALTTASRQVLSLIGLALTALAILPPRLSCGAAEDPTPPAAPPPPASIQWFGTWKQGAAEALRTGRPILLLAAAPQCHGISGIW